MTSPQDLFSYDIGVVDDLSRLNCSINLHQKSFRYFKSSRMHPTFNLNLQLKRWAFGQLHMYKLSGFDSFEYKFLPVELLRGNLYIISVFLQQLRRQKVESFIRFRIQKGTKQHQSRKLANLLNKILQRFKRDVLFRILSKNGVKYQGNYCFEDRKNKKLDYELIGKQNRSVFRTPQRQSTQSLNVTYKLIDLSIEKYSQKRKVSSSVKIARCLPVSTVLVDGTRARFHRKKQLLEQNERCWSKQKRSKRSSSQL